MGKAKSPKPELSKRKMAQLVDDATWDLSATFRDEAFIREGGDDELVRDVNEEEEFKRVRGAGVPVPIENPHWDKALTRPAEARMRKDGSLGEREVTLWVSHRDLPLLCDEVKPLKPEDAAALEPWKIMHYEGGMYEADAVVRPGLWLFPWKGKVYDSSGIKLGADGKPRKDGKLVHILLRDEWASQKAKELVREEQRKKGKEPEEDPKVDQAVIQAALSGLQVHHVDECHLNVTRANLCLVTQRQNMSEFHENKAERGRLGPAEGIWRQNNGSYTVSKADGRELRNSKGEIIYDTRAGGGKLGFPRRWWRGNEKNYDENGNELEGQATFPANRRKDAEALAEEYRHKRDLAAIRLRRELTKARKGTGVELVDRRLLPAATKRAKENPNPPVTITPYADTSGVIFPKPKGKKGTSPDWAIEAVTGSAPKPQRKARKK